MPGENHSDENPKPNSPPESKPQAQSPGSPETASQPPKGGHHVFGWTLGIIVVLVFGLVLYRVITGKPPKAPQQAPLRVSITNAAKGDIGIYVTALGSVTPIAMVSICSQVTGQLTNVNYVEGQMVKAGDLLVQIDERPFQASLMQAQGQLARDQALLQESQIDLKRYEEAASKNAIPKQQLDDQMQLTHQYAGTVKFDEGQVESANVQLAYCRIIAPVSGRVGLRLVDPGNLVIGNSTSAIVVIAQLQPITIIFSVAEDYLPQIQHQLAIGNKMVVDAFDRSQQIKLASGTILALDNVIDPNTGTVRLRSIFTNADNALFPNQFVNVRLLIDTLHDKTLIPAAAVQRDAQNAFLYILKPDNTVEMRTIKTDVTDEDTTAVEGVNPGEVLVTDNFNRLQDGDKVAPRTPGENADQSPNQENQAKSGKKKKKDQSGTNTESKQ